MYRRILFNDDDVYDEEVIGMQRRPKIFYERVNYLELYDDHDFINRFRLSKSTFNTILRLIENEISPSSTRNRAILAPSKLYMTLRYLATGSFLLCVADFTGVSESSACRYVHQVCRAIARQRPNFISFPTSAIDEKRVVNGFYSRSKFPRVVGAIDGTHIKIQSPGGDNAELFRNRKGWFSINTQCVCNPWLKIMDIVARWPGSSHDQIIFDNSNVKQKFETGVIKGYLLGDSGYEVKPYLMTPLLNPTTRSQQLYNESHIRTRNIIERCFGVLKRRFPFLSKGLTVNLNNTQAIIVACAVLHNICVDMHDDLPDDEPMENNFNNDVNEHHIVNLGETRGRQERDRLINDHFANLQLLWSVLLAIASVTILVHLYESWKSFSYSSMQIIVDDPRYPLSKIDFPAITICPTNKISYLRANKFILNKYENNSELKEKYENSLYIMGMLQHPYFKELSYFAEKNSIINLEPLENITDLMLKLMPSIDDAFESCYWRGSGYNCSDIIRLQRTEEGFCYSFNSKTSERSPADSEINPPASGPNGMLIPLRNNAAGKMTGIEIILRNEIDDCFPIDKQSTGYNVMIHTPEDFPDISSGYKLFSENNQSTRISIKVSHIKAGESLHRLNEIDRKCFLYERRSLRNHNFLSRRSNAEDNCYSNCRLGTIKKMCGCTPYYFKMEDNNETCCGIEHLKCLGEIDVLLRNVQVPENEPGFPDWSIPIFMNCSCPQPCSFIGYTTEIRNFAKDFLYSTELPHAYIHIDIHYKERFAISYQRSMKYTTQDLLVTFGGMASLFLGCSLVSVVEIIYVVYKMLLMLKHKYTKVHKDPKRDQLILYRRYHTCHFRKPLYKPPIHDSPPNSNETKY